MRISKNSILSVLEPILVISKLWAKAHRGRFLVGHSKFHDMKKNRSSTRIQTLTRISSNSILIFLLPILVISKLWAKAHRGRLLAGHNKLHDMKKNRSPRKKIKTFTRISNNSILSVLLPVMVPSKLLGKPHNSRWMACRSNLNDIKNNRSSSNQVKTFTRISINSILMRTQLVGIKIKGNLHCSSIYARSQRMYNSRINIGPSNQMHTYSWTSNIRCINRPLPTWHKVITMS